MRKVLSISLPEEQVEALKMRVKKSPFQSVSAYISYLLEEDNDEDVITTEELLNMAKEADKEYDAGQTITFTSFKDLV